MQSRTARPTAPDSPGAHPHQDAAGLGVELATVVAGARRRAVRDGDRQVDTAHLLHSLLEQDPEVRSVVGGPPQLARLLGYLVQRSIGYGLRWQGSVEDSGAIAVVPRPATGDAGDWSPAAADALHQARERARRRGGHAADAPDLFAALVADPDSRAVEVLERAGIDARELSDRISVLIAERSAALIAERSAERSAAWGAE
ncbi:MULTISPECIES: Clp protease N-terminal domain-containing protein [Streptomyces]|uniref:ATP-dependent Clp protease ATP-binding subunit ClpA n=1 Tax=Streptomyces murinus TaxID=33900 RepID=A0A7W3NKS6_STRMR|nr:MULTISPECIES: Clp protease N-terminal domain-containing protein [Streptomyces]MBA9052346.1 ATP-dependent Clp protease ATP-binding subunit ClpA [Streptomyces murinus]UWW93592.1 peptidase [Streptomyces murinus]